MILKWNNGQKRVLNIKKKLHLIFGGDASAPYAPLPPSTPLKTVES